MGLSAASALVAAFLLLFCKCPAYLLHFSLASLPSAASVSPTLNQCTNVLTMDDWALHGRRAGAPFLSKPCGFLSGMHRPLLDLPPFRTTHQWTSAHHRLRNSLS